MPARTFGSRRVFYCGGVIEGAMYNVKMVDKTFADLTLLSAENALRARDSQSEGLSQAEAHERLSQFGPNALQSKNATAWEIFVRQFSSAFIYLLLAASLIALYLGEYLDAGIIFLFLLINAGLGFFQEYRAEHALSLLERFVSRTTSVRRNGTVFTVPVAEIVPGDIVLLDAGDMVPADGYFLRADGVTVDESPLTGESRPVEKHAGALSERPAGFYGAANIAFARTTLLSGDAELLIFATGARTEIGSIASALAQSESPSAFEEGVNKFSKFILKLVLFTVPLVFFLHALTQENGVSFGEFLLFAIALTVSAIPEALPLVTTISLSRGALKLAKMHVVPRRLSAIEDLGSIDVLCTDKTGTITENALVVSGVYGNEKEVLACALIASRSATATRKTQNSVFDHALLAYGPKGRAEGEMLARIDELPFDPLRRRESVLVEIDGKHVLAMRGAPEAVYALGKKSMPEAAREWATEEGKKGSRVLAIARKSVARKRGNGALSEADENGVTVLGMIAFSDPLKPSTKNAVAHAKRLGVAVKIITGDSKEVAGWVGAASGITDSRERVLSGEEFASLSPEAKRRSVEEHHVFARMLPLQKNEIIALLKEKHLVGFLGEGFNDAPALKAAHVGLAVSGASDIARDAADIVLLNSSLEVIILGIKEGRAIFANSIKYIRATLTSNFGNFYALALASLFIPFLPMLPVQVLLLNLLSDFPMISIATDTVDDAELRRPRGYQVGELTAIAVVLGIVSTIFDFAFFGYFMRYDASVLQTMWFMGSVLTELILLFSIRTALPFWKAKRPSRTVLWLTFTVACATVAIPFVPVLREIFDFALPTGNQMAAAIMLVLLYFASTEIVKLLFYRFWRPEHFIAAPKKVG